jgi:hypothetical protein
MAGYFPDAEISPSAHPRMLREISPAQSVPLPSGDHRKQPDRDCGSPCAGYEGAYRRRSDGPYEDDIEDGPANPVQRQHRYDGGEGCKPLCIVVVHGGAISAQVGWERLPRTGNNLITAKKLRRDEGSPSAVLSLALTPEAGQAMGLAASREQQSAEKVVAPVQAGRLMG